MYVAFISVGMHAALPRKFHRTQVCLPGPPNGNTIGKDCQFHIWILTPCRPSSETARRMCRLPEFSKTRKQNHIVRFLELEEQQTLAKKLTVTASPKFDDLDKCLNGQRCGDVVNILWHLAANNCSNDGWGRKNDVPSTISVAPTHRKRSVPKRTVPRLEC